MRINNTNNNIVFGKVIAVSGKKELLDCLKGISTGSKGSVKIYDSPNFYKKDRKKGFCKIEKETDKDVLIFVTGEDDTTKIYENDPDWNTFEKIEKHISQIFSLKNVREAKDQFAATISNYKVQKEILREMLK